MLLTLGGIGHPPQADPAATVAARVVSEVFTAAVCAGNADLASVANVCALVYVSSQVSLFRAAGRERARDSPGYAPCCCPVIVDLSPRR